MAVLGHDGRDRDDRTYWRRDGYDVAGLGLRTLPLKAQDGREPLRRCALGRGERALAGLLRGCVWPRRPESGEDRKHGDLLGLTPRCVRLAFRVSLSSPFRAARGVA